MARASGIKEGRVSHGTDVAKGGSGSSTDLLWTPNTQTSNYTLVLTDAHKTVELNVPGTSQSVTIPPNSSVAFPIGTQIRLVKLNDAPMKIVAGGGVTLRSRDGMFGLMTKYATVDLVKRGTDEWVASGDLGVYSALDDIAGLYGVFDATRILGLVHNDPVATWADVSGNGRDATQGTPGSRPTYITNAQNGKPMVHFNGSQFLSLASVFNNGSNDAVSMFIVSKRTAGGCPIALRGLGGPNSGWLVRYEGDSSLIYAHAGAGSITRSVGGAGSAANAHLLEIIKASNTSIQFGSDRSLPAAASNSSYTVDGINTVFLGQGYAGGGDMFTGDIGEIRLYTGALGTTDRQTVENYLTAKWGTP